MKIEPAAEADLFDTWSGQISEAVGKKDIPKKSYKDEITE